MKLVRDFGKGLLRWIDTSEYREPTSEELAEREAREAREKINKQIAVLKKKLADTDYKQAKFIDGALTEAEYAPIRAERQAWRDEINELEAQLQSEGQK